MIFYHNKRFKTAKKIGISILGNNKDLNWNKKTIRRQDRNAAIVPQRSSKATKSKRNLSPFQRRLQAFNLIKFYYHIPNPNVKRIIKQSNGDVNVMFDLIQRRLDNTIYILGFAQTRQAARQLISHKKIILNNHPNKHPSAMVKLNDVITVTDKAKKNENIIKSLKEKIHLTTKWAEFDPKTISAKIFQFPTIEDQPREIIKELKYLIA